MSEAISVIHPNELFQLVADWVQVRTSETHTHDVDWYGAEESKTCPVCLAENKLFEAVDLITKMKENGYNFALCNPPVERPPFPIDWSELGYND